ncbi:MAG: hypothetical protein Fur0019_06420 [Tibeticola sp.]
MPTPVGFTREMAFSRDEWLRALPEAVGLHPMSVDEGMARVRIGQGNLSLRWHAAPARRIALLALPRLMVRFEFEGLDTAARDAFMKRFDLYMHRGGG